MHYLLETGCRHDRKNSLPCLAVTQRTWSLHGRLAGKAQWFVDDSGSEAKVSLIRSSLPPRSAGCIWLRLQAWTPWEPQRNGWQ